jgi:hypothetical protein
VPSLHSAFKVRSTRRCASAAPARSAAGARSARAVRGRRDCSPRRRRWRAGRSRPDGPGGSQGLEMRGLTPRCVVPCRALVAAA